MVSSDYIVVGGGIVGAAIAYGLARAGEGVTLLDEGDVALRAARGNFGNVWVQGKGGASPDYADLTRQAANDWAEFARELEAETGLDLHFRRPGAAYICFSPEELAKRGAALVASNARARIQSAFEVLDRAALSQRLPGLGPAVAGGTFCPDDGTANPLYLLRALIRALVAKGGRYLPRHAVTSLAREGSGHVARTPHGAFCAGRIVLAAGLANATLAPMLGLSGSVRPVRGQIMVTEKVRPFLPCGTNFIRQTVEGGCIFGESSEEVGTDDGTTLPVLRDTARKAIAAFPLLRDVRVVRAWGALRIMTPDGVPVYQGRDGAFVVCVHSGVTLAPWHAGGLVDHLRAGGFDPATFQSFQPERFDVQAA
jgi:glycine/D-amino acid oxidase-like deaminating enzyme